MYPSLIQCYEEGRTTTHQLILEILSRACRTDVDDALLVLPQHLHVKFETFLDTYIPGEMLSNGGPIQHPESVNAAKV